MSDRNTAHTQEAPSSYLQGKYHTIADYTDIMLLIALKGDISYSLSGSYLYV